jgi:phosphatidylserine/phosphatidylglycerophosphate/cardiolipin synthase-like enzyme
MTMDATELVRAVGLCQRGGGVCYRLFHRILGAEDAVDRELATGNRREAEDLLMLLEGLGLVRIGAGLDGGSSIRVANRPALVYFAAEIEQARGIVEELARRNAPHDTATFVATLPADMDGISTTTARSATSFTAIAREAKQRLAIVTPFLDQRGLSVFRAMAAIAASRRVSMLVLTRESVNERCGDLRQVGAALGVDVEVLLPSYKREDGRPKELVHAKVVVADRQVAYVGSANLTAGGMTDTVEVGVLLRGPCVDTVADFVDGLAAWARQAVRPAGQR